jgi:hypothetical protein
MAQTRTIAQNVTLTSPVTSSPVNVPGSGVFSVSAQMTVPVGARIAYELQSASRQNANEAEWNSNVMAINEIAVTEAINPKTGGDNTQQSVVYTFASSRDVSWFRIRVTGIDGTVTVQLVQMTRA